MPLSSKGEKIKSAMEEQYGEKKGEKIFYASKNKGVITGVDAVTFSPTVLDSIAKQADALVNRFDSFMKNRLKRDEFEEARHPRNAGGTFVTGEGEEGKEDSDINERAELRTGGLSKRT